MVAFPHPTTSKLLSNYFHLAFGKVKFKKIFLKNISALNAKYKAFFTPHFTPRLHSNKQKALVSD